jgi:uncharacterized protein (TIGR02452 family)
MSVFDLRVRVWNENKQMWPCNSHPRSTKHIASRAAAAADAPECSRRPAVSVVHEDTLDATLRLIASGTCSRPLVLNMADDVRPGGCVAAGGGMQEESLFRRTNLHAHLLPSLYPIACDEAVYSPDVIVCRRGESEGYRLLDPGHMPSIGVVSCPGVAMPALSQDSRSFAHESDREALRAKVRAIFEVAVMHGHDAMVLGALGCGAFGCPPDDVAAVFKEELERASVHGVVREVVFAILGAANNAAFSRVLDGSEI